MAREIEFLPGPDPDPADDLEPDSAPPARPWRTRLLAAAAVLALGASAVWIAHRPTAGDEPRAGAPRTTVVTATPSSSTPSTSPAPQRVCTNSARIDRQFLRLVERNLPGLQVLPAQSYRCTLGTGVQRRVVSESLAVRFEKVIIEVQATRRVGDSGQYLPVPAGHGLVLLTSVESQSAGLNVIVESYGTPRQTFDGSALSRLASDISLLLVL